MILAGGRDPLDIHSNSFNLSAESGLRIDVIFTDNGHTWLEREE